MPEAPNSTGSTVKLNVTVSPLALLKRPQSERTYRHTISPLSMRDLGIRNQRLVWLGKAYDDRSGWLPLWLKVDPKFDALRSDPRFQDLLRRIGLAP